MTRTVGATLDVTVEAHARLAVQVAVADAPALAAQETIDITLDGRPATWRPLDAPHGGRVWLIDAPPGRLHIDYRAVLTGGLAPPGGGEGDQLLYLRPSRYCESDRLMGFASRLFRDIGQRGELLAAVSSWVGTHLDYLSGSSDPTDGAVDALLAGRGVCRDYAHLVVALLRALEVPARLVAVYAPGLEPMDFHAVAEAYVEGGWHAVDSTLLAPRASMVRIATGRDAADTAFLSSYGGAVVLDDLTVTATVADDIPTDDVRDLVQLR